MVADPQLLRTICGPAHANLAELERAFAADRLRAESQGGEIVLTGENDVCAVAARALKTFIARVEAGAVADPDEVAAAVVVSTASAQGGGVVSGLRPTVMAKTPGQSAYIDLLQRPDRGLIFGVGPAGTGKTYLAVAVGAAALKARAIRRLVIARPAVEAGEKLGFLPGTQEQKVDPYMLPIWDALNEFFGAVEVDRLKERREIEVAPLAFMRGRTMKDAFVIIDEAQNATIPQMKMVLTRLGRNARMVVTGDPSQTDLPDRTASGLSHALRILDGVEGVSFCRLTSADIQRHELVGRIVKAYDDDAEKAGAQPK